MSFLTLKYWARLVCLIETSEMPTSTGAAASTSKATPLVIHIWCTALTYCVSAMTSFLFGFFGFDWLRGIPGLGPVETQRPSRIRDWKASGVDRIKRLHAGVDAFPVWLPTQLHELRLKAK